MTVNRIAGAVAAMSVLAASVLDAQAKGAKVAATVAPPISSPMAASAALSDASIAMNPTWSYQVSFPGMTGSDNRKEKAIAFHYEVKAPRDVATGMASGKRMHKPITIVKEWGASTPLLMQALSANSTIPLVTIDATGPNGTHHTMKLSNVHIISVDKVRGPGAGAYAELALTFEKIEMDGRLAKTSAADDWTQ